jgi:hypothetical protein
MRITAQPTTTERPRDERCVVEREGNHMRYLAVALLPRETSDIQSAVARLMAPYDLSTRVAPYKKYLSQQAVNSHAARLGVDVGDFPTLAARINEHYAATMRLTTHFQADVQGVYVLADTNPNGKYKRWALNSLPDDVWWVAEMPRDLLPHAVITPDGQWHELFPNIWGRLPTAQDQQRIAREAYTLIDQYPDHLAARLECHF